jgi:FG-GAP-like repeat
MTRPLASITGGTHAGPPPQRRKLRLPIGSIPLTVFLFAGCAPGVEPETTRSSALTTHIQGDIDGDGKADIALTGGSAWGSLPVAFSNGDGTFRVTNAAISNFATYAAQNRAKPVFGDFNGDGKWDVALVGGISPNGIPWGTVPVAFSNGDGTFRVTNSAIANFETYAIQGAVQVISGDFDGDGKTDLALTGGYSNGVAWGSVPVAFSNGDGTFRVTNTGIANFGTYANQANAKAVSGDFNGDGKTDIALTGGFSPNGARWGSIPIAFSNGDGSFHVTNTAVPTFAQWASGPDVHTIAGDFDGDGKADVALTGGLMAGNAAPWAFLPVAFSNGDGSFRVTTSNISGFATYASQIGAKAAVGDFNGDGKADIALTGGFSNANGTGPWGSVPVAFSNGDGTFRVTNSAISNFALYSTQTGAKPVAVSADVRPSSGVEQFPAAPSQLKTTGADSNYLYLSFKDNTVGLFPPTYNFWEILNTGTAYLRWGPLGTAGPLNGPQTASVPLSKLTNKASACVEVQAVNSLGTSMYSNIACGSGGSMPNQYYNVGVGNGILTCTTDLSDCGVFPSLGETFTLLWAVCNNGNIVSPALNVSLVTMSPVSSGSANFNLPNGVGAGQCVQQSSGPITPTQSGPWSWDVYLNGVLDGTLEWNF